MRKLVVTVLAGAGALFAGSAANAADIYPSSEYPSSDLPLVQPVRMICSDDGRCYRTRGGSHVIIRDSYNLRGGFFVCMGAPKGKAERSDSDAVDLQSGKRRHASHKSSAPSQ